MLIDRQYTHKISWLKWDIHSRQWCWPLILCSSSVRAGRTQVEIVEEKRYSQHFDSNLAWKFLLHSAGRLKTCDIAELESAQLHCQRKRISHHHSQHHLFVELEMLDVKQGCYLMVYPILYGSYRLPWVANS